jgi:hypothetical protein
MTGVPCTERPTERPYSPDAPDATKWWHVVRSGMTAQEAVEVPPGQDGRVADRAEDADADVPSNYELHLMMLDGRIGFRM